MFMNVNTIISKSLKTKSKGILMLLLKLEIKLKKVQTNYNLYI